MNTRYHTNSYDKANQLVSSTTDGKVTHYAYDAAGRMIQAGDKSYIYNGQNKVTEVRQNGKTIAKFEYNIDGQIAKAIYGDKVEEFMWDGLALIWRSGVTYINEPYVTGGNPVMAGDDVLFNDMLGNTLAVNDKAVEMTSFGETADKNAFFTGKPMVDELGYSFLFRDYNPNQGKWTTTDPLGYPDGWNNLAYCNNDGAAAVDIEGLAKMRFTLKNGTEYTLYDPTANQIKETIDIIKKSNQKLNSWHIIGHANNELQYTNDAGTAEEIIQVVQNKILITDLNTYNQTDITSDIQAVIDFDSEIYLDGCNTAQSEKWICSTTTDIAREMSKIINCVVSGNTGMALYPGNILFDWGWTTLRDKQSYRNGVAE